MESRFTPGEQQLLIETLAQHAREMLHGIARANHREFKRMLQLKMERTTRMQLRIAAGEFQLEDDESDLLREALEQGERALCFEIARTDGRKFKHMLQRKLDMLLGVRSKLSAASKAA
jgi:phage terminase Nu1 subunit (DNA packaging protein)